MVDQASADDEYGLPPQLDAIVDGVVGQAERMLVPNCGYDPNHQARLRPQARAWLRALAKKHA